VQAHLVNGFIAMFSFIIGAFVAGDMTDYKIEMSHDGMWL